MRPLWAQPFSIVARLTPNFLAMAGVDNLDLFRLSVRRKRLTARTSQPL